MEEGQPQANVYKICMYNNMYIYISYTVGVKNNDIVTYVETKTFSVWNQDTGYALSLVTIARDSGSEHPLYPVG